jgi:hypothetical protein
MHPTTCSFVLAPHERESLGGDEDAGGDPRAKIKARLQIQYPTLRLREYRSPCRSETPALIGCAGFWG